MGSKIEVGRLTTADEPRVFAAIDRILLEARPLLVRPGEVLVPARERAEEAEQDPHRLLVWAAIGGQAIGFADAVLHAPSPLELTIAQLAVRKRARRRNVGRRLVLETLLWAEEAAEIVGLFAAIHPDNHGALAFWERLGLAPTGDETPQSIVLRGDARAIRDALVAFGSGTLERP